MKPVRAVIFDMDGLMIDSERLYFEVEREIASDYGKTVPETTLWKMMGRSPLEAVKIFVEELGLPVSPKELLEIRDGIMKQKMLAELGPMPGLFDILRALDGKYALAVATGAPTRFLDIALDKLDIRRYFKVLQTSDGIAHGKPDPEIYLETAKKLGLPPSECAVLEDSSNGARSAKSAGCLTIAVPNEFTRLQDFSFVDKIVKNLFEASEYIARLTESV
ncbi:MAG: HAD family hydrolase [Spirochaetes bacterium GWF1_51_8]|nr:MAG: HAD family hydrolase [Spirochaetes bacterium GWF1_51_8]